MRARATMGVVLLWGASACLEPATGQGSLQIPESPSPEEPAPRPNEGTETPTPQVDVPARIELSALVTVVPVGRQLGVTAKVWDTAGELLSDVELRYATSDASVASIDDSGRVTGLAEGSVELTAAAGEVVSAPLTVRVLPVAEEGPPQLRLSVPSETPVALAVGQTVAVAVSVRSDRGEAIADATPTFALSSAEVASIDAAGVLTALAPGVVEVVASYREASSPPLELVVAEGPSVLDVSFEAPSGDVSAFAQLHVQASTQWLEVGAPSTNGQAIGVPVLAEQVRVLLDEAELGTLVPSYGAAAGSVSLTGVAPGIHTLRLEVTAGTSVARSRPLHVSVVPTADDTWTTVGSVLAEEATLHEAEGKLRLAATACRRFCEMSAYEEGESGFDPVQFQMGFYRTGETNQRTANLSFFNLTRFVGWGYIGDGVRAQSPLGGELVYAWSNFENRRNFNDESMPQRYWFDCHVAQWDGTGGLNGQGGWRLLTEGDSSWLWSRPTTEQMTTEFGDPANFRFPAGTDIDRTRSCDHPHVVRLPSGELVVAQLSTPIPDTSWQLELRRWTGSNWVDVETPLLVAGELPALAGASVDAAGRVAVTLVEQGVSRVLVHETSGWVTLGDQTSPAITAAVATEAGTFGVGLSGGDARAYLAGASGWTSLGEMLDVDPWAEVHEVSVATSAAGLFIAWTEGPSAGNRDLYAARWDEAEAGWVAISDGPIEADPDLTAFDPELIVRADGRLAVRYSQPTDDASAPMRQLVRVTAAPIRP